MGVTIAYDLPVLDLIDELSATGHVTHTQHRKDCVTLHHNGGRLSHEGVLSVWQERPASAHFNSDAAGSIAQFVRIAEYAWATGDTEGNQRSVSIEMCNETVGPEWRVGEATWKGAARLTGWIHAKVFGWRPSHDSLKVHHDWFATACAGPFVDRIFGEILEVAQYWYDVFIGVVPPATIEEDDDMVYQVNGGVNDKTPDWLEVLVPPVQASYPLPDNGQSKAWVQLGCPQSPLEIWGVWRVYDGGSSLLWGPGEDPRTALGQIPAPAILKPDTYKVFELNQKGTTGLSILYGGPVPLSALVTLQKQK